jgi:hypothetical protein
MERVRALPEPAIVSGELMEDERIRLDVRAMYALCALIEGFYAANVEHIIAPETFPARPFVRLPLEDLVAAIQVGDQIEPG